MLNVISSIVILYLTYPISLSVISWMNINSILLIIGGMFVSVVNYGQEAGSTGACFERCCTEAADSNSFGRRRSLAQEIAAVHFDLVVLKLHTELLCCVDCYHYLLLFLAELLNFSCDSFNIVT